MRGLNEEEFVAAQTPNTPPFGCFGSAKQCGVRDARREGNLKPSVEAVAVELPFCSTVASIRSPGRPRASPLTGSDLVFGFHHDQFDRSQSTSICGRFGFPAFGTPN